MLLSSLSDFIPLHARRISRHFASNLISVAHRPRAMLYVERQRPPSKTKTDRLPPSRQLPVAEFVFPSSKFGFIFAIRVRRTGDERRRYVSNSVWLSDESVRRRRSLRQPARGDAMRCGRPCTLRPKGAVQHPYGRATRRLASPSKIARRRSATATCRCDRVSDKSDSSLSPRQRRSRLRRLTEAPPHGYPAAWAPADRTTSKHVDVA